MNESRFGSGFLYCIGLFLKHAKDRSRDFFMRATDHLLELEIPQSLPEELRDEWIFWKHDVIDMRNFDRRGMPDRYKKEEIIEKLGRLLEKSAMLDEALDVNVKEARFR